MLLKIYKKKKRNKCYNNGYTITASDSESISLQINNININVSQSPLPPYLFNALKNEL